MSDEEDDEWDYLENTNDGDDDPSNVPDEKIISLIEIHALSDVEDDVKSSFKPKSDQKVPKRLDQYDLPDDRNMKETEIEEYYNRLKERFKKLLSHYLNTKLDNEELSLRNAELMERRTRLEDEVETLGETKYSFNEKRTNNSIEILKEEYFRKSSTNKSRNSLNLMDLESEKNKLLGIEKKSLDDRMKLVDFQRRNRELVAVNKRLLADMGKSTNKAHKSISEARRSAEIQRMGKREKKRKYEEFLDCDKNNKKEIIALEKEIEDLKKAGNILQEELKLNSMKDGNYEESVEMDMSVIHPSEEDKKKREEEMMMKLEVERLKKEHELNKILVTLEFKQTKERSAVLDMYEKGLNENTDIYMKKLEASMLERRKIFRKFFVDCFEKDGKSDEFDWDELSDENIRELDESKVVSSDEDADSDSNLEDEILEDEEIE